MVTNNSEAVHNVAFVRGIAGKGHTVDSHLLRSDEDVRADTEMSKMRGMLVLVKLSSLIAMHQLTSLSLSKVAISTFKCRMIAMDRNEAVCNVEAHACFGTRSSKETGEINVDSKGS